MMLRIIILRRGKIVTLKMRMMRILRMMMKRKIILRKMRRIVKGGG
jgi:hypothetical protein